MPVVVLASEHECLLDPNEHLLQHEVGLLEFLPEKNAAGVGVAHINCAACFDGLVHRFECVAYELAELRLVHVVVRDREFVFGSSLVCHVVWRVCENAVDLFAFEELLVGVVVCAVSADEPVRSELPNVAALCYRLCCLWHPVGVFDWLRLSLKSVE